MVARLLSVNVGLPREIAWRGQTVRTAVWKVPVQGKRMVRRLNIGGDGQGDLVGHGGEQRAVFVYQMDSYRYWQHQLHRADFTFGQFGENFTVEGLPDAEVCIGDRYRIGGALFEVTQPRVTCYRVGIRMDEPRMAALLVSHGRPGFYFRVLQEGEVQSGDEIAKVLEDPQGMSVAEINELLYLPGHPRLKLERALRIPALSAGWRSSLQALLQRELSGDTVTGNPGLTSACGPPPAWPGFRRLRVSRIARESDSVFSVELVSADNRPLAVALPGQFVVVRLRPQPEGRPLLRSYSLSGAPGTECYRLGIKQEPRGAASDYVATGLRAGDTLEVSAPRGSFVLRAGDRPVVLLSAGIEDPPGVRFDSPGRLEMAVLERLGVSREADFYICGPGAFLPDYTVGLAAWGVARQRVHTEIFGPAKPVTPGIVQATARSPHPPAGVSGQGPRVSFARSGLDVSWDPAFNSLLELAEACDVPVQWSCRTGVCHTCETALIAGAARYDPEPVEPPADGNLLTCCSCPQGDVIIDL